MQIFDDILEILKDGHFQTFEEVLDKIKTVNENQLECIIMFLDEYGLVKRIRKPWSNRTRIVRLSMPMQNFFKRFNELDSLTEVEAAISKEESNE